MREDADIQRR